MKTFALIGAAGYIAPRHMKAIKDIGGELVAALDPHDSVGILDSYFPECHFFTEFERFDRHLEKLKRKGKKVDYISVCSPNYLHDAHIRYGLRYGADVICEKPIVLNPWNVGAITELEAESKNKVHNILQLRLHPEIIKLKEKIENGNPNKIYEIDLTYITPRGNWYFNSWKGNVAKSGGIATNIGVHFFDMLLWIFGAVEESKVILSEDKKAKGELKLKRANIRWFLSLDKEDLPNQGKEKERSLLVDGKAVDFTSGFEELHIDSYKLILEGKGFSTNLLYGLIELINKIRNEK